MKVRRIRLKPRPVALQLDGTSGELPAIRVEPSMLRLLVTEEEQSHS